MVCLLRLDSVCNGGEPNTGGMRACCGRLRPESPPVSFWSTAVSLLRLPVMVCDGGSPRTGPRSGLSAGPRPRSPPLGCWGVMIWRLGLVAGPVVEGIPSVLT